MRYFNDYVSNNQHHYSCDMIRLKFEYHKENEFEMCKIFDSLEFSDKCGVDVQYFRSFRSSGFRHLFVIKKTDSYNGFDLSYSFSIGLSHNMDTDKNAFTGFIEFNPNKCDLEVVSEFMYVIKRYSNYLGNGCYFDLLRYDLAIDIYVPRHFMKLVKKGKRVYTYIQGKSLTEYLGNRHTDGFCKLYDKAEESGLDYDVTRLEITCCNLGKVSLPDVVFCDTQYGIELGLNQTDYVLVTLIKKLEEQEQQYYLSKLGRNKREKLRPFINGSNRHLEYDRKGIIHVQDIVQNAMRIIF